MEGHIDPMMVVDRGLEYLGLSKVPWNACNWNLIDFSMRKIWNFEMFQKTGFRIIIDFRGEGSEWVPCAYDNIGTLISRIR